MSAGKDDGIFVIGKANNTKSIGVFKQVCSSSFNSKNFSEVEHLVVEQEFLLYSLEHIVGIFDVEPAVGDLAALLRLSFVVGRVVGLNHQHHREIIVFCLQKVSLFV